MPYTYDAMEPGLSHSFSKTVSERDVVAFGEVSGDTNPLHFDDAFAAGTIFKGRIVHGMLAASYISTVLGMELPGPGTLFVSLNVRFKAPVRIGDTVVTTCTVREKQPRNRVLLDCVCKVGDTVVTDGEVVVMPPLKRT